MVDKIRWLYRAGRAFFGATDATIGEGRERAYYTVAGSTG
jgi:hypothetical protein